ncbi:CheR family methyltransferase [Candidatus Nitrosotalea okcheonensis]|uniref:protein-glutamate O-methyltransferase n=1 Tax=Candidatus Nitrosotalea okcheonensis TaxID=1903276 RepID=A0A2H1FDJ9_9ARCH|nr:protein-glutamate O-methyltransferase CheR [Candidatus Nitrosotalea okcheonensis]SMH70835.1 putative Chemotaxis protein methyltransferase [Candidatus Nitrosotalea okcheonensis]
MSLNDLTLDPNIMAEFNKVFASYGLDLARYKPAFIKRRLDRRMRILNISEYSKYLLTLRDDRKEFEEIFASLSINVTNFFRDSAVFDRFQLSILPKILSDLRDNKIRVWSAGCASGEEPYSIAMMFKQATEKISNLKVEIIANDVNKFAIEFAQRGIYPAKSVESLPVNVISNNFQQRNSADNNVEYEVISTIKNMVTFKVGDILSYAIQYFDVIFCRNVLIYYEKEAQELIFTKFYNGLKESGYLVLGMDETMFGRRCQKLFNPLMARERIYQKVLPQNN